MKYKYLSTLVMDYGINTQWRTFVDPLQHYWEFMGRKYRAAYFQIRVDADNTTPFYILSTALSSIIGAVNSTIGAIFVQTYTDNFFQAADPQPSSDPPQYLSYIGSKQADYQVYLDCCGPFPSPFPADGDLNFVPQNTPLSELPDLNLIKTRYVTDMKRLDTSCLVSVNGFFHQTQWNETKKKLFVIDGGKTQNISGFQSVGLFHFDWNVDTITKFALSSLSPSPTNTEIGYHGPIGFVVPSGVDLTANSILLSLGGYLMAPNSRFLTIDSANSFTLDLSEIYIEHKIVEMARYMDLTALGLANTVPNALQTDTDALTTNTVLEAIIGMSQSFLIVIPKNKSLIYTWPIHRYAQFVIKYRGIGNGLIFSKTGRIVDYLSVLKEEASKDWHTEYTLTNFRAQNARSAPPALASLLYTAYPDLIPKENDIVDQFVSLGYFTQT